MTQDGNTEETILQAAARLVDDERENMYGPPGEVYADVADFWATYLDNDSITSEDVCIMMILLKIAREKHSHKKDNLVDGAGYFRIYERIRKSKDGPEP